jgi:hypothetical protein
MEREMTKNGMPDLSLGAIARGQYAEGLKDAVRIIEARLPLYTDIGQINALRECISSLKGEIDAALKEHEGEKVKA